MKVTLKKKESQVFDKIFCVRFLLDETRSRKASDQDLLWLDHIAHQKQELWICCLAMYANCNLPGELLYIN